MMEDARERRLRLLEARELEKLRSIHGDRLARALSGAAPSAVSLDDFDPAEVPPYDVKWSGRIEDSPGLVVAYVARHDAMEVLRCIHVKISGSSGKLGVFENRYLGLHACQKLSVVGMLEAAEEINDSVIFYPDSGGAVIVDCYASNVGSSFSVLAQGEALVSKLERCFKERGEQRSE